MRLPDDLTGRRFGRLTVVSPAEPYIAPSGVKRYAWNCVCDCGGTIVVRGDYLRRGQRLHCSQCPPLPPSERQIDLCRDCKYSERNKKGWICEKGLDPTKAERECSGYWCGAIDKLTGVHHRESKCFICGAPIYSNGNDVAIYCEEHREYAERDAKLLREAPTAVLFGLIASIFLRARDDYLFDTDGKRQDAEEFFRSTWAKELSMWEFDADEALRILDEVIENGFEEY